MEPQTFFERYELKYLLTRTQKDKLEQLLARYADPDPYGHTLVCSLYYDTPTWQVIRQSLAKPAYKEKFRLRCYGYPQSDTPIFAELKKKFDGIVYKRRMIQGTSSPVQKEIDYFRKVHGPLRPACHISCQRDAWQGKEDASLRITIDQDIEACLEKPALAPAGHNVKLLDADTCLLEVKCSGGMPLWLARFLSQEKIRQTSFSKYGTAYQKYIQKGDSVCQKHSLLRSLTPQPVHSL